LSGMKRGMQVAPGNEREPARAVFETATLRRDVVGSDHQQRPPDNMTGREPGHAVHVLFYEQEVEIVPRHCRRVKQPAPAPPTPQCGIAAAILQVPLLLAALTTAVLVGAVPAAADEPGESTVAHHLVREAIALMVNTPGDMEAIREKVGDALEVEDQEGVDIALVRQADEALAAGDMHEARALLERSIGARPHQGTSDVAPIGEVSDHQMARGGEPGDAPIVDPLDTSNIQGSDAAAIAAGAILALGGILLGWRWRPTRAREV
jgi:hypothetical protein